MNCTWIARRLAVTACLIGSWSLVSAQAVRSRILEDINPNNSVVLPGSVNPRIARQMQTGRMAASTPIEGITLTFALTPEQEAELKALIQAQLTPGNPEYHQWLTPAAFAARFGLSPADVQKVEQWLQSQGFSIVRVANSRTSITFSGTVEQVENAFQTQMNRYTVDGKAHWSNGTSLSIPAALQGVVLNIGNLNDFRPHPMMRRAPANVTRPAYTSSQSGDNYMTPGDVATIYDINAAYNSSGTGAGVTIAIMGQSEIEASDIQNFDNAAGVPVNTPNMIVVPGSGASVVSPGDEAESDLDTEYSGAIAKGATIDFVYTGSNSNDDVFDSLQYAVDNDIGSVISISYGACEQGSGFTTTEFSALEQITAQGASQGQTIVASAGDSGSTACYGYSGLTLAQEDVLAVNYPASSDYVTGVGGTEFASADLNGPNGNGANASQYWSQSNATNNSSALSYIPETAWNDDVTCGAYATKNSAPGDAICSGGGGVSAFASKPTWQTGVTGLSSGGNREVPDISLDSSNVNAPYLFCTGDQSAWQSGQSNSCNAGFRDSSSQDLTAAGGTSFAAPIFAGMMAIIDQKTGSNQGIAAAELYSLASTSSTYGSAFHDTPTGSGNNCTAGSSYCTGDAVNDYTTTTGYDEATGLGSVDLNNLLNKWPVGTSNLLTTTTVVPASSSVAEGASDLLTITVASASGTPTGTVTLYDGTTEQTEFQLTTLTLNAGGVATYPYAPTTSTFNGTHVLEVVYSGGGNFSGSSATVNLTVSGGTVPPAFTMTPSPSTVTVSAGATGTSSIAFGSQGSYAGTVLLSYEVTSSNANSFYTDGCLGLSGANTDASTGEVTVPTGGTTATLTFYTSSGNCSSSSGSMQPGFFRIKPMTAHGGQARSHAPFGGAVPLGASALAGLLLFGFRRKRSKLLATLGCLMLALALGGFATGCGGGGGGTTGCTGKSCLTGGGGTDVAAGTYTFVLYGADTVNGAITAQTSLTLTIN